MDTCLICGLDIRKGYDYCLACGRMTLLYQPDIKDKVRIDTVTPSYISDIDDNGKPVFTHGPVIVEA